MGLLRTSLSIPKEIFLWTGTICSSIYQKGFCIHSTVWYIKNENIVEMKKFSGEKLFLWLSCTDFLLFYLDYMTITGLAVLNIQINWPVDLKWWVELVTCFLPTGINFHSTFFDKIAITLITRCSANFLLKMIIVSLLIRDDIADHMKWSKRLGCDRIIHSEEVFFQRFVSFYVIWFSHFYIASIKIFLLHI